MYNGDWIGFHERPDVLVDIIREIRREGSENIIDPKEVSVNWDITNKEIKIFTD